MLKYFTQILLITFISNFISAQSKLIEQNQITVLGSVELKEIADEASLYFTVKGVGENLRNAVGDAEKKTKEVIDKLSFLGIKKNNISTSDFMSGENYGDKAFLSSSRDYKANIITSIKTDSLELLKSIIFTISESNVESISEIYFSLKDELGLRRRARMEAGLKAKEKAEDIGKSLGVKVGKVISIDELQPTQVNRDQNQRMFVRGSVNYPNPFNPSLSNFSNLNEVTLDESKGSAFFAQTISVTSIVKVTFVIE